MVAFKNSIVKTLGNTSRMSACIGNKVKQTMGPILLYES